LTFVRNALFYDSCSQGNIIFYRYTIYSLFYFKWGVSKGSIFSVSKASSTFNPNITTTYARPPYLSGSNSKRGIIGTCALSARTYNAEVQGSDARIRNRFVIKSYTSYIGGLCVLTGSALDHRSLPPEFQSRHGYI